MKYALTTLFLFMAIGCASTEQDSDLSLVSAMFTPSAYRDARFKEEDERMRLEMEPPSFHLGTERHIVAKTFSQYERLYLRNSDQFLDHEGNEVVIDYYISREVRDAMDTDDEVIPYKFVNTELTSVGWLPLGGMKNISERDQRSQTEVNIEQNVHQHVKQIAY